MDSIKFFRNNSAMECSCWPAKHKVIFEIAPAFPDKPKGQPQPGSKLYDYQKKIKISFNPNDIQMFAYALLKHSNGEQQEYKKMADMAKVVNSTDTDKKSLMVNLNDKGGVGFFLSKGTDRVNIILNKDEAFALAQWLMDSYLVFYNATMVTGVVTQIVKSYLAPIYRALNIEMPEDEGGSDDETTND